MSVQAQLGPGFLEAVYRACLWLELTAQGLHVEEERTLPVIYRGVRIDAAYGLDFIVEKSVLVDSPFTPLLPSSCYQPLHGRGLPVMLFSHA